MRIAAAIACAWLVACSSFEADTPASSDAGAMEGGVMEGGSSATRSDSGAACDGGLPFEPFATTEKPTGWVQQGTGSTGTIEVTGAPFLAAQGNYLHASITNSSDVPEPPTFISPPIAVAKHVRLEYDLAVKQAEHYGELGCELELWGPTADKDLVVLYLGVERETGVSLITGWNYRAATAGQQSDESSLLTGWAPGKWQHVVMDVTIEGSQVSTDVSIDGGTSTKTQPPTAAYSFREVHVRCGILYLSPVPNGGDQTMELGIDNIAVCTSP